MRAAVLLAALLAALVAAAAPAAAAPAPASPAPAAAAAPAPAAPAKQDQQPNPILATGPFPLWDKIKPSHVVPAVKQLLQEEEASLQLLEQDLTRSLKSGTLTFGRVFKPYTQIKLRLDSATGLIDHLQGVKDSEELRNAVEAAAPLRTAFALRLGQSKPIYEAVAALKGNVTLWGGLSPSEQRIVSITLQDFKDSGVGLAPEPRKRFNELVDRQQKLITNYTNNVFDSTKERKLLITNKTRLEGLQQTTLAVAAKLAREEGHANATTEGGPWLIMPDYNTYAAVVAFAKDRGLRQEVYTQYRALASSGAHDNTPIVLEVLKLRKELANILGYKTYAESSFATKMATYQEAQDLLRQMVDKSRPVAVRENEVLTAFARNATGDANLTLLWWDTGFWPERMREALYNVRQEELREYLPLDSVLKGLFGLAKELYGIEISLVPKDKAPPVWDDSVQVYAISEADGGAGGGAAQQQQQQGPGQPKPFAYFYADLFARPGAKQGGAWTHPLWDAARYRRAPSPAAKAAAAAEAAGGSADGGGGNGSVSGPAVKWNPELAKSTSDWLSSTPRQVPLAILVANQEPPADGKPSLMTLDDVETLFHEFGHVMQHLLTNASQGLTAGMRNIEWDAVETASQMQEKWVYDNSTFNSFARHWKTGEKVPTWMFEQVKRMKTFRKGNAFTFQLVIGVVDLALHSTFDPNGQETPLQLHQREYDRIMPIRFNPADRQLNNLNHVFGGGYASGYYSYMWADVMSTDAYMAFEEGGMDNLSNVRKLGRRFRSTFLADGGAVPPAQVFKDFRGRPPQLEPLLKYNGLV